MSLLLGEDRRRGRDHGHRRRSTRWSAWCRSRRPKQALAALKKMAAPNAQVIRDGHQMTIPSRELVVGRHRPARGGQLHSSGHAPGRECQPEDRGGLPDRGVGAGRQERQRGAGRGNSAGRPQEYGLHEHPRDLRARQGPGHLHGHAHADRHDRRNDPVLRGGTDPAAAETRSAGQVVGHHLLVDLRSDLHLRPDPRHPSGNDLSGRASWPT